VSRSIIKQKKQDDKVIGSDTVDIFDLENKFVAIGGKLPETV
jgi:hypothetical protein